MEDFDREQWRWLAEQERGTWREDLRTRYAPWLDELFWGFEVGDGWRVILSDLLAEIAAVIGDPDAHPGFKISQIKEKYGELRFYIRAVPAAQADAIDAAVLRAEARSRLTCETCGAPGELRATGCGYLYTACTAHIRG